MQPDDLAEWMPVSLRWEDSGPVVEWRRMDRRRFTEPFFEQTLEQHRQEVRRANRSTPADALLTRKATGRLPRGFIFHASRCGSTLVAQMLAALPRNIVLSEPAILHQVLNPKSSDHSIRDDDKIRLLQAVIGTLGRPRNQGEQDCFVKFSSNAISKVPLIRRAFPKVPWVFLYREPLEILGAYLRSSADQLPPAVADAGLLEGDPAELAQMLPDEFWTRVLAARLGDALKFYQPGETLLLNYAQLPEAAIGPMLKFFGVGWAPEDLEQMRRAATWNAKEPSRAFQRDNGPKRQAVPASVYPLVEQIVMPRYQELESIRTSRSPESDS